MRSPVVAATIVVGLIAAGCSVGSSADSTGEPSSAAPADTASTRADTAHPVHSDPASTTDDPVPDRPPTSNVPYMTMNGVELVVDVYAPSGVGPWPIVVTFHGLSTALKDAETNTAVAEEAARRGLLVFAPTWIAGDPFPITIDDITMLRDAGNCAVAFAQQRADAYGGDPTRTVVAGFSAGTGPALTTVLAPPERPVSGCTTDAAPNPIAGALLGDGEYFWQSENFDDAFRADPDAMQTEVAVLTNPMAWPAGISTTFFVWTAADGTAPRGVDEPDDASGWLAARDPDGSIRDDLERLGQLDDGVIDYVDSARLLTSRLETAGLEVTLQEFPGGHTTLDKTPALADALFALATGP